jgi:DNA-binding transcriptional LysR family regulator
VQRQDRVTAIWNWLPAFRAVAERQHVKQAARERNVTPSALSRSIHLLEQELGKPLFDRVGRNLRLNKDGRALLASVRDGMRGIDDGVGLVTATAFTGTLRIACDGDHPLGLLGRALVQLRAAYPLLVPVVDDGRSGDLATRLARGELDVAFVSHPVVNAMLRVKHLADFDYGIYAGRGHPLHRARAPGLGAILAQPFVAPTPREHLPAGDNWPPELERLVAMYVPSLEIAVTVAAGGHLLAVLPDVVVRELGARTTLRRLPVEVIAPSPLYAVRRRPLSDDGDAVTAIVERMKAVLEERGLLVVPARTRGRRRSTARGA